MKLLRIFVALKGLYLEQLLNERLPSMLPLNGQLKKGLGAGVFSQGLIKVKTTLLGIGQGVGEGGIVISVQTTP